MESENRSNMLTVRFTDPEMEKVRERMKDAGIVSRSAFLRKMVMDGYILNLNLPEMKEMISLLRYASNNLNQIAKRANSMGKVFEADLTEIKSMQNKIWENMNLILKRLGQFK